MSITTLMRLGQTVTPNLTMNVDIGELSEALDVFMDISQEQGNEIFAVEWFDDCTAKFFVGDSRFLLATKMWTHNIEFGNENNHGSMFEGGRNERFEWLCATLETDRVRIGLCWTLNTILMVIDQ